MVGFPHLAHFGTRGHYHKFYVCINISSLNNHHIIINLGINIISLLVLCWVKTM